MLDDGELLRRYATAGSEEAFAELVKRHVDAIYGVALRQMGDGHGAQDVVQLVFASLARQAASLARRPEVLSWLYTAVHFTAGKIRRSELRRDQRQMKALVYQELSSPSERDPDWSRLRLVLDDAMHDLGEKDRQVILVRFFQSKTYPEIGELLGLSEDGVRKRLHRSTEKLRAALARRGITSTSAAVATALSRPLVAAPAGLATAATTNALTSAKLAGIVGQTLAMTSIQKTLIAAGFAAALGVAVFERQQVAGLQSQVTALEGNLASSRARVPRGRNQMESNNAITVSTPAPATENKDMPTAGASPRSAQPTMSASDARRLADQEDFSRMKAVENDTTYLAAKAAIRANDIRYRYFPLATQLNLSPSQRESLFAVLGEMAVATEDVRWTYNPSNQVDPGMAMLRAKTASAKSPFIATIKGIVGDEGYARLEYYDATESTRDFVTRFEAQFIGSGDALTNTQRTQLIDVLAPRAGETGMASVGRGGFPTNGSIYGTTIVDEVRVRAAAAFLNPTQLRILRETAIAAEATKAQQILKSGAER